MRSLLAFLLIFLLAGRLQASEIKACYDVKVIFLTVAESCISYGYAKDKISVRSHMKTINIGSLAKRVYDYGEAAAEKGSLRPVWFKFYQEEGGFKRYQEYVYDKNIIRVQETKYKGLTDEIEKDERKTYPFKGEADPYIAALTLFKELGQRKEGVLKMFYDDRFYNIPYKVIGEERIFLESGDFDTWQVLIKPKIMSKGLLRPRGDWYLWIDKNSRLPVKMSVGFIIGSVKVYLKSTEGDRNLINKF